MSDYPIPALPLQSGQQSNRPLTSTVHLKTTRQFASYSPDQFVQYLRESCAREIAMGLLTHGFLDVKIEPHVDLSNVNVMTVRISISLPVNELVQVCSTNSEQGTADDAANIQKTPETD